MLDTALRLWFAFGLVALPIPGALQHNHWIGWVPYWLVLAPALSLALMHRHRLLAALPARRRRRRTAQALMLR